MKTITYICDKCKQSKSESDIVVIETTYQISRNSQASRYTARAKKDVCKQCLESAGMLYEMPDNTDVNEALKKSQKSFEDKLIDLLYDLGVQFQE